MATKQRLLKVFLSYASQDESAVREVYNALKRQGWIDPWLDKAKILPGQDWRFVIERAVEEADVVIICLSRQLVNKEGFIQREIRYAYEVAREKPEETIFLIPLRLDECELPRGLRALQRVDYFGPGKENAFSNLLDALRLRYEQKNGTGNSSGTPKSPESLGPSSPENGRAGKENVRQREGGRVHTPQTPAAAPPQAPVKSKPKKAARRIDPSIVAALIGVAGTILVTLITLYASRPTTPPISTPTLTATFTSTATFTWTPTVSITPEEPTPTSITATDAPVPTITVIPPVALAEDWISGCISTLWRPYPGDVPVTEKGDGCWKEPVHVFFAENGDLDFLAQKKNAPVEIYGLFAPLPEKGSVTFTIRLRELSNVDLWMGVFAEPDVESQGLLMIIPAGNINRRVFVQKDPSNYETIASTSLLRQEGGFSISFRFDENSARSTVNPSVFFTNSIPVASSQKWLFLGYKGLRGSYRIDGTFLSFQLD